MSVRAGGVDSSGVDPVDSVVVFGEDALGREELGGDALGEEALGVDVVAGGGFDAVVLELVVRSGCAPARASQ